MKTYLFYDIETTGLNKAFDQVLQFAAIRTNEKLQELSRQEILIQLRPDVLPSPGAVITHGLGLTQTAGGMNEYQGILAIHKLMNEPGTISLGYNTLGFDDEFLRFNFYRNLLSPYTHQYANQCGRMDIYPMALMYFLYKREGIEWPMRDGRSSLKLADLSDANQLAQGNAHDAMVDVEATLALARRFMQQQDMWHYLTGYFHKQTDIQRQSRLATAFSSEQGAHRLGLMVLGRFGAARSYLCPVLNLGVHRQFKNQNMWLRLDDPELQQLTMEDIPARRFVVSKKSAEPGFLLPCVDKYLKVYSSERWLQVQDNLQWLEGNKSLLVAMANYNCEYTYPEIVDIDVDAALYSHGFFNDAEQRWSEQFHRDLDKQNVIELASAPTARARSLATRILGRCYPHMLQGEDLQAFQDYNDAVMSAEGLGMSDHHGEKRVGIAAMMAAIKEVQVGHLNPQQQQLLEELSAYLQAKPSSTPEVT